MVFIISQHISIENLFKESDSMKKIVELPKNAYTELKSGEKYVPIIQANETLREITFRSVGWGIFMCVLFSLASSFLGLKVGQVFEAAIPIAILAVGMSNLFKRRNTILENVIIQSIGAMSGVVVAGAIFTLPAMYILKLDQSVGVSIWKLFIVSLFGGILGILFLIPFIKYFVAEMHGKFPFPEATATTEILVAGEKGGDQAKTLLIASLFAGLVDWLVYTFHTWPEVVTSRIFEAGRNVADKIKMEFRLNILASILGLGYIIGLRYSAIIVAGSFLSWYVLVPAVFYFGQHLSIAVPPAGADALISGMNAKTIFETYVNKIGIGAIAAAGIIAIIKSYKVIWSAFSKGFGEIFKSKKKAAASAKMVRTDRDLKMSTIIFGIVIAILLILIFFRFFVLNPVEGAWKLSLIAFAMVTVFAFLFTTVAARAIAIVGSSPVSGMTLMTLILSSVFLVSAGLTGTYGMLAALLIGGVVCTALSVAGGFITDLKVGYWIGSTPWNQQRFKFLGALVASLSVAFFIPILSKAFGFSVTPEHPYPLAAPQANAMAAVLNSLMSAEQVPWLLYGIGIFITLAMELGKMPSLAFALGMYLPIQLTLPLVIGGLIGYIVAKSSKDNKISNERKDKGTLIASGFIAGGAIMGVVASFLRVIKIKGATIESALSRGWDVKPFGGWLALGAYAIIIAYLLFVSMRIKKAKK
jgi:putative OPT family oligopeptide transporter